MTAVKDKLWEANMQIIGITKGKSNIKKVLQLFCNLKNIIGYSKCF